MKRTRRNRGTQGRTRSGLPAIVPNHPGGHNNEAEIAERRARAFELRKDGWPYRRIATELGVGVATAHDDVRAAMEDLLPIEVIEQVREMEADRLDHLMVLAMNVVADDAADYDTRLKAIDKVLAVQQRRAKLLGLDAPERLEVGATVTITAPSQIADLRDDLAERRARAS